MIISKLLLFIFRLFTNTQTKESKSLGRQRFTLSFCYSILFEAHSASFGSSSSSTSSPSFAALSCSFFWNETNKKSNALQLNDDLVLMAYKIAHWLKNYWFQLNSCCIRSLSLFTSFSLPSLFIHIFFSSEKCLHIVVTNEFFFAAFRWRRTLWNLFRHAILLLRAESEQKWTKATGIEKRLRHRFRIAEKKCKWFLPKKIELWVQLIHAFLWKKKMKQKSIFFCKNNTNC